MQEKENFDFVKEGNPGIEGTLSEHELEQVVGGYNTKEYNRDTCDEQKIWGDNKCNFCAKCKFTYNTAIIEGLQCNAVHFWCMYGGGYGVLMRSHYSLPTGETVKIELFNNY